jgi:hypothetical protein
MNNEMVKLLLVDCCRDTFEYLSEKIKFIKSPKRFSYTDFVIAIIAKARTNKRLPNLCFQLFEDAVHVQS